MAKYLLLNDDHKLWRLPKSTSVQSIDARLASAARDHTTVTIEDVARDGFTLKPDTLHVDGADLDWWTIVSG